MQVKWKVVRPDTVAPSSLPLDIPRDGLRGPQRGGKYLAPARAVKAGFRPLVRIENPIDAELHEGLPMREERGKENGKTLCPVFR